MGRYRCLSVLLLAVLALPLAPAASGTAAPAVLADVPVTGLDERLQLAHNSPLLLSDPSDPAFVVLASRLDNPDFGCSLHLSGDGGRGWVPVNPVPRLPPMAEKCYAPEAAFAADGRLYYLFIALAGEGNSPTGTYLVTSDDRGRSFSKPRQVLGPERYMVRLAIDRSAGKRGRLHVVWLEAGTDPPLGGLAAPPNPLMAAWSDDGGRTFSTPARVSDPERRVVAPALALGPGGTVHVLYYDLEDDARDYQGLEGPTWEGNWSLRISTSTDGGQSFGPPVLVDADLVPPERVMLIYTMPPPTLAVGPTGALHAAWHDARNGDWDVFTRRSTDGGRQWDAPVRLNDDSLGSGLHQYMPRLSVSPTGRVDALFLDRRADPGNVYNQTYLVSSSDGGSTFGPNTVVSSEASNSTIGTRYAVVSARGLVEWGSRLALLSMADRAVAAWTDTRDLGEGEYSQNVFATEVDFGGGSPVRGGTGGAGDPNGPGIGLAALLVPVGALLMVAVRRRGKRRHPLSGPAPAGEP